MEKCTQIIEVKHNFREKNFFHLLQTFHHYIKVQCVNRLGIFVTKTTQVSLGELSVRS